MRSPQINIEPNFLLFQQQVDHTSMIIIPKHIHNCQYGFTTNSFNKEFNF